MNRSIPNLPTTFSPPRMERILPLVFKAWRWSVACALLAMAAVIVTLMIVSPKYEVSASVLFQLGREMAAPPTVINSQNAPTVKRAEDIPTEIEIMTSNQLIEELVRSFGEGFFDRPDPRPTSFLQSVKYHAKAAVRATRNAGKEAMIALGIKRRLSKMEEVIVAMQNGLTVEPVRKSDVVRISLVTPDPEGGVLLLKKFLELYQLRHIAAYQTPQARTFFATQLASIKGRLETIEARRLQLKKGNRVWSADEQRKQLIERQKNLATSRAATAAELSKVSAEIQALTTTLQALPAQVETSNTVQRNPLVQKLEEKVRDLEQNYERLRLRYADDTRILTDAKTELEQVRAQLKSEQAMVTDTVTSGPNELRRAQERTLLEKQTERDGLAARLATEESELAGMSKAFVEIENVDAEFKSIDRESQQLEQAYSMYSRGLEETHISEAMELSRISNVSVIAPPAASLVPVWPPARMWLLAAAAGGLAIPLAIAFLLEAIRPAVRSRVDISQTLDAPVLVEIPNIRRRRSAKLDADHVLDEFHRLAADLQGGAAPRRRVLITSATAGEGASHVAANLAIAAADSQHVRTLVIDANFRRSAQHKLFGVSAEQGLRNWDGASEPAYQATEFENVFVLAAGRSNNGRHGFVSPTNLAALARRAAEDFDLVIWDCPPVTERADAKSVAAVTDGVLVVVEGDATRTQQLEMVREQLSLAGANVIGAVINRAGRFVPRMWRTVHAS